MFLEYKIQFWNISNKERKKKKKKSELWTSNVYTLCTTQSCFTWPNLLPLLIPSLVSLLQLFFAGAVVWVVIFLALSRPVARVVVLIIVILHFSLCSCSLLLFPLSFLLKLFTHLVFSLAKILVGAWCIYCDYGVICMTLIVYWDRGIVGPSKNWRWWSLVDH